MAGLLCCNVIVKPEVTGYLGHDVTLSCLFIQGPENANITQVQWDLLEPEGKRVTIIVSNSQFGVNIHDSPLKGRVEIKEQSLIIKDVEMADAGLYMCTFTTFPSGSFEGRTKLVVKGEYVKHFYTNIMSVYLKQRIFVFLVCQFFPQTIVLYLLPYLTFFEFPLLYTFFNHCQDCFIDFY
uniref:Ig-like domain-containing protein n=1 Tax=Lates calcarifer TaxID=8187 RepID=A0A4W6BP09_LATCA